MSPVKQFGCRVGLDKPESFEGWFTKVDDRNQNFLFSVIWGYSTHRATGHAFLQFTSSLAHQTVYVRYPLEDLHMQPDPFVLRIGGNELSEQGMRLDFEAENVRVQGTFTFGAFTPIRTSFFRPNIMGWMTWFPNECNHAIISMAHRVDGNLRIGENTWALHSADGYIEKDWGRSFPREYVWVHANGWEDSAIVFSYATVPILGKYAKGFFLMLHHQGREYRFSSIEGARMLGFEVSQDAFQVTVRKGSRVVSVRARQANPVALASPSNGEMRNRIKESLDGTIEVRMTVDGVETLHLTSDRASIDVHY